MQHVNGQSELISSVPRGYSDTVRFFDDMDVSDRHLHTLHQSIRDLNSGQQRLRQELEEERLRRTRYVLRKYNGTRNTFYGTRYLSHCCVLFCLKTFFLWHFKNVIGQQRYQCYQILGHMTSSVTRP